MKHVDISKIVFVLTFTVVLFVCGMVVGAYQSSARAVLDYFIENLALIYHERTNLAQTRPEHFLQPARYDGDGVTVNTVAEDEKSFLFLLGFFKDTNELRLIARDGSLVARWPVRYSEIFTDVSHLERPPVTHWNTETHGALILPDGSIVFNFEYAGLVKLDRCGRVLWTLPLRTHHSVEHAEGGGFWVGNRRHVLPDGPSPFPPFEPPYDEDSILKVSEDGAVLAELSVPKIFFDNGLGAILTASGRSFRTGMSWDREILHLNKVEELTSDIADDFPLFEAGDLALSIRDLNMVLVIDPRDGNVKWWHIGPWLRQHDPEFIAGGKILVFNNNTFETAFGSSDGSKSDLSIPRVSNIIEMDPVSLDYKIVYGGSPDQALLSVWRGKVEATPTGGLLVTEFEGGRVFETDAAGNIIWEYVNRFDRDEVAEITEARLYPTSYFTVSDWSCDGQPN